MRIDFRENGRMALKTLRENKLRSFLTVLGVVIGITSLISVASIMVGLDRDMRGYLTDYGAETLFVFKFSPGIHVGRLSTEERTRKSLTNEDAIDLYSRVKVGTMVVVLAPRQGDAPFNPMMASGFDGAAKPY